MFCTDKLHLIAISWLARLLQPVKRLISVLGIIHDKLFKAVNRSPVPFCSQLILTLFHLNLSSHSCFETPAICETTATVNIGLLAHNFTVDFILTYIKKWCWSLLTFMRKNTGNLNVR